MTSAHGFWQNILTHCSGLFVNSAAHHGILFSELRCLVFGY